MSTVRFPLWILAGGKGFRIGTSKGLLRIKNRSWLEFLIEQFGKIGGKEIWIGLGADNEEYFQSIPSLPNPETSAQLFGVQVHVVINQHWNLGQFSTLCSIIRSQRTHLPTWVLPVDCTLPDFEVFDKLEPLIGNKSAVVPQHNGQSGHPVLLHPKFYTSFLNLDPKSDRSRLDLLIKAIDPSRVENVIVSDFKILTNINTTKDWEEILNLHNLG